MATKKTKQSGRQLLELGLKGISQTYNKDSTSPGLVMSWLAGEKVFYVSIARYESNYKRVEVKFKHTDLDIAIKTVLSEWRSQTAVLRQLDEELK